MPQLCAQAQSIGDLDEQRYCIGNGQRRFPRESRPERLAGDQRHHVEGARPGIIRECSGVDQPEDVRMLELRGELDLGEKALAAETRGDFRPHDFDRDFASVSGVMRGIHGRHTAFAELMLDVVAPRQTRSKHRVWFGHADKSYASTTSVLEAVCENRGPPARTAGEPSAECSANASGRTTSPTAPREHSPESSAGRLQQNMVASDAQLHRK
jgi:hypothetical protein